MSGLTPERIAELREALAEPCLDPAHDPRWCSTCEAAERWRNALPALLDGLAEADATILAIGKTAEDVGADNRRLLAEVAEARRIDDIVRTDLGTQIAELGGDVPDHDAGVCSYVIALADAADRVRGELAEARADVAVLRAGHAERQRQMEAVAGPVESRLYPDAWGEVFARADAVPGLKAELRAGRVILDRHMDAPCPLCGHALRRHDPEDHACDAPSDVSLGRCGCPIGQRPAEALRQAREVIARLRASEASALTDNDDLHRTLARQGELLTGVAVALRGEPPALTSWGSADLPERAAEAMAKVAALRKRLSSKPAGVP